MKLKFSTKKPVECKICEDTIDEQRNCEFCNCEECAKKEALDAKTAAKVQKKSKRNCEVCDCKCAPKLCGAPCPTPADDSCDFCHSAWWKRWMRS